MLRVGGFIPLSASDWPGMLVAVVFCQGCPWRCRYCHNPHLIPARREDELEWEQIIEFLRRRRGLLDGVVFSGGEPTLQRDLPDAMQEVRELGFKVGLHTSGSYPRRLAELLPLVDWVGMDIKAPLQDYPSITGVPDSGRQAFSSLEEILRSGAEHEIRTTVHPALLTSEQLAQLACDMAKLGVKKHVFQKFRREGCEDEALLNSPSNRRPFVAPATN
jgi:pyruvate formate lyase activating enzyme